ncbi:O-antigen ligase family protein [Bacteroides sp. UBA939]|uniref:O-antigen ligase family protein n=1 Tax=Bacteroides sp. UBA939 TaxID=1946092 RepID=UPI0039C8B561
MRRIMTYMAVTLQFAAVCMLLSLVCVDNLEFLSGETIGQWIWFDKAAIWASSCILLSFLFIRERRPLSFSFAVSWGLILFGGIEAVYGLRQLYGFAASGHSLYALTGSFFNPGPYSGYLAMVLPVCLHQWLVCKKRKEQDGRFIYSIKYTVAGGVMLLILCVLPAGMSRSAWLAAGISCLWVYACYMDWNSRFKKMWHSYKWRIITAVTSCLCVLLLAGYLLFSLKPDSARGRLFMWKIACSTIEEKFLQGHGIGNFAAAYGDAQETYFAAGGYEPWEERVAGSPEYAFNEYLQVAVELGVPVTLFLLSVIITGLYIGIRKKRYGICGALLSLMVFSFSSYPLQLPVFVVTSTILFFACILGNSRWLWLLIAVFTGITGGLRLQSDLRTGQACREWTNAKVLYNMGAYESAEEEYHHLYPILKNRAAFLFEYGHCLHKQEKFEVSNRILREALNRSNDPMILNIIGKNCQQTGDYNAAESWFIRSTHRLPGRLYPYYLLAKLYAAPDFHLPDKRKKLESMIKLVLTKEPKVNSTAVQEMKEEILSISKDSDND